MFFSFALVLGVGLAIAAQSPTNAALGKRVGVVQASMVSFAGGTLILGLICLAQGGNWISELPNIPAWQFLGGTYGAFAVFSMALAVPQLGVALTLALCMLGQLISGMVVDGFGLLNMPIIPISPLRGLGFVAVLGGILCVYGGNVMGRPKTEAKLSGFTAVCLVLSFFTGFTGSIQAPTNAALATHVGMIQSSFINFLGGFLVLLVLSLIVGKGKLHPFRGVGIKPWHLTGGAYGAFGVTANLVAVTHLGVSLLQVCTMLGQLVGAMVVDSVGLFETERIRVNLLRVVGCALLFLGIVLVGVGKLL